jgi:hypothetical protein
MPVMKEGFAHSELVIGPTPKGNSYIFNINLSDYSELLNDKYRMGQKYSYNGITKNLISLHQI